MYDNDLFNMFNSYTATEEDQQIDNEVLTGNQSYSSYEQKKTPYYDDYSTNQNFEEETSYNSIARESQFEEPTTQTFRQMNAPRVIQQAPAVKLTKNREKMYMSSRLKVATVVFSMIFALVVFASIWNFAMVGKLQASFDGKQFEISQLQTSNKNLLETKNNLETSIEALKDAYIILSDSNLEENKGYVENSEGADTLTLSIQDFYTEPEVEKLSSNWFNDVCEFFSKLFA